MSKKVNVQAKISGLSPAKRDKVKTQEIQVLQPETRSQTIKREERGMGAQEEAGAPLEGKKQPKTSRDVHFCVLPDKYEPLIEESEEAEEDRRRRKEEKKRKRKKRCKKCRKNICKALRFSWRCLLAGLQSMASTYSTPLSAMPTVMMEMKRPGSGVV